MPRLLILIPAVVREARHLEMVRVQSLLRERMAAFITRPNVSIVSCVVYDAVAPEFLDELLAMDFSLRFFSAELNGLVEPSGIRRPTQQSLSRIEAILGKTSDLFILRIIQDAVVLDAESFTAALLELIEMEATPFLAGGLAMCGDVGDHMGSLGLPRRTEYQFVQGAVLFAPFSVWKTYYPRLPATVTHYSDDSVFSQLVVADGGKLIEVPSSWDHRHGCPVEVSRTAFAAQRAELNHRRPADLLPNRGEGSISVRSIVKRAFEVGMVQIESEILALASVVASLRPRHVLEIGSDLGGTFYIWAQLAVGMKISVDLPGGPFGQPGAPAVRQRMASFSPSCHLIDGDSRSSATLARVLSLLNGELLDFLFIDGDHSEAAVRQDWEMYAPLVRPGGLIALHDVNDTPRHRAAGCMVSRFWASLAESKVTITAGHDWGGIGLVHSAAAPLPLAAGDVCMPPLLRR